MTSSPEPARIGSQRPRVRSVPPYASSSGPEAVALAKAAGLVPDEWQSNIICDCLGEGPDGQWTAFESACWVPRQNGKGGLIEIRVLAGLFLLNERLIMWSAHEYKTAQEGFLRIKELIQSTPSLDKRVARYWQANGEQGIELKSGQRLRFIARSRGSGRGFSGDLIILDEAQFLTAQQMKALFSTMAARKNPQVFYFGTPPDDPRAWVYGIKRDGEAGKARLAYFDFGADLDLDAKNLAELVADRDLWYATNPALGIRLDEQFVEDELSRLGPLDFAAERLGAWLPPADDENQWLVISQDQWKDLRNVASELRDPVAFALGVTPDRSAAAIGAAGVREDGLGHVEVVAEFEGLDGVVARMVELDEKWMPCTIAVAGHGPAAPLVRKLQDAGLDVTVMTTQDESQAYADFYDDAMAGKFLHRDQKALNAALAGAETRDIGDGLKAWGRKSSSVPIAHLEAVTNAKWAHAHSAMWIEGSLMA